MSNASVHSGGDPHTTERAVRGGVGGSPGTAPHERALSNSDQENHPSQNASEHVPAAGALAWGGAQKDAGSGAGVLEEVQGSAGAQQPVPVNVEEQMYFVDSECASLPRFCGLWAMWLHASLLHMEISLE